LKVASILRLSGLVCLSGLFSAMSASPLSLQFSGNVTQIPVDEIFGDITAGELIRGSFSFDPAAVDLVPTDPATGVYASSSPFGTTVTIGSHEFTTSGSITIGILNSFVDQYTVFAASPSNDLTLELFFQDNTGTALSNDHLPLTLPALSDFQQKDFHLDAIFDRGEVQVDGQVGGSDAQAVPEPASAALSACSFALLALARLRRHCNSTNLT
jgi:hypothetical protein